MAYVYLNDGGPESEDYDSNYFYFDENNLKALALIENLLTSNAERNEAFRDKLNELCQYSLTKDPTGTNGKVMRWIKELFKSVKPSLDPLKPAPGYAQN